MPKNRFSCSSLIQAIETALKISCDWGDCNSDPTDDIWYRGANDTYDLIPSAHWRKNVDEYSSVITFRQLVSNYINTYGYDEWDYYYLARHHGIPTRLLDWSTGIMPALFFAFDQWNGKTTPCIWMVRPHIINMHSIREETVLIPRGNFTINWLPPLTPNTFDYEGTQHDNTNPLAIYPRSANPRLHSQQGVFTIHGLDSTPLNTWLESKPNGEESIARIDLHGFDKLKVQRELHYLGMHQSFIYPDADHLARDIGYMYGWGAP